VEDVLRELDKSVELVLLDCLSFLVSNLLLHYQNQGETDSQAEEKVLAHILNLVSIAEEIETKIIIVSNEVGMGVVPETPLGRLFRDIQGRANQIVAAHAHEVFLLVAGLPVKVK